MFWIRTYFFERTLFVRRYSRGGGMPAQTTVSLVSAECKNTLYPCNDCTAAHMSVYDRTCGLVHLYLFRFVVKELVFK